MKNKFTFLLAALLASSLTIQAQNLVQIGQDVYGEAAEDLSGTSVSLNSDGSVMAVGATRNSGTGIFAGHVRIYQDLNGTWTQIGQDIDSEAAGDWSGDAVSLSADGSIVAIGAPDNDANGTSAGQVRVYQNLNGVWTQIGQDIDGVAANDYFGNSVSLSSNGTIVAIGAYGKDANGADAGQVKIFENKNGTWTKIGQDLNGDAANDKFGESLSLNSDGSIVAIGAPLNDQRGNLAGLVRIFQNQGGTWIKTGELFGKTDDVFGKSVSLSADGSVVAVGATSFDFGTGYVACFKNQNGSWLRIGEIISGASVYDYFGSSVSLSADGSVVAIGAPENDGSASEAGHVRIYQNISGTWTKTIPDIEGEAYRDFSGTSVSLSSDGLKVAIGAPKNDSAGIDAGHVKVYKLVLGQSITISNLNNKTYGDASFTISATGGASGNPVVFTSSNENIATCTGTNGEIITIINAGQTTIYADQAGNDDYTAQQVSQLLTVNKLPITLTVDSGQSKFFGEADPELVYTINPALIGNDAFTGSLSREVGETVGVYAILQNDFSAGVNYDMTFVGANFEIIQAINDAQIGEDVDGETAGDQFGRSVSLSADGMIMAVGAPYNDGNGVDAGHVRVYENLSGVWTQIGQDIEGEAAEDESGSVVKISSDGSIVAIGAPRNNGNGVEAGHVRIYHNQNGTWTQIGQDIDGTVAGERSGVAIDLSSDGSIVAVGAYYNDAKGLNSGQARVYQNQNGAWVQVGQNIDGAAGDLLGQSLSLSANGTIIALGSQRNSYTGGNYVRILQNQSGVWTQVGQDIVGIPWEYAGYSISLSADGSVVAIGAIENDDNGSNAGIVRVYQNQNGTWTQKGQGIVGEATLDYSGKSVSLSADGAVVAIGAASNDGTASNSGHARVYLYQEGTWIQIGEDFDGEAAVDVSGFSVSLSADGSVLAIGAPYNDENGFNAGHVRVYNINLTLTNIFSTPTITNISIYPNPTIGSLSIDSKESSIDKIEIFDISGKMMYAESNYQNNSSLFQMDISALESGIYLVNVQTTNGVYKTQIRKE